MSADGRRDRAVTVSIHIEKVTILLDKAGGDGFSTGHFRGDRIVRSDHTTGLAGKLKSRGWYCLQADRCLPRNHGR